MGKLFLTLLFFLIFSNSFSDISLAKYCIETGSFKENLIVVGCNGYLATVTANTGILKNEANMKGTGYYSVAMVIHDNVLYVGIHGHVIAYHPESLRTIWSNDLKGLGYSIGISVNVNEDKLYVGTFGKVCAINRTNGETIWTTSLPRCGYSIVTLSFHNQNIYASCNGNIYKLENTTVRFIYLYNFLLKINI